VNEFQKRFYTFRGFLGDLKDLLAHFSDLRVARRRGLSRAFVEKVMLAVTVVNECGACSYLHAQQALKNGAQPEEIWKLLSLELGQFPEHESVALAFAQHCAETRMRPDPEAVQRLLDYYSPEVGHSIIAYIQMVNFGTLVTNTLYAFLSRLKGKPAPGSNLLSELLIVTLTAPFTLLTLFNIARGKDRLR